MKTYLLLRNNHQSGPYSFEEVKQMNLQPLDLVWIEGKSICWRYPSEVDELKNIVAQATEVDKSFSGKQSTSVSSPKKIFVSLPARTKAPNFSHEYSQSSPALRYDIEIETKYSQPLDEIKQLYAHNLQDQRRTTNPIALKNVSWLGALLVVLIFGAILTKKIVDGFDRGTATNEVAAHVTSSFPAINTETDNRQPTVPESSYQSTTSNETVLQDTVQTATPKPKKVDLYKLVTIKSSDYKVGVFGGINDLALTVINRSSYNLDKVSVELEYVKPNGETVQKQILEFSSVTAKSAKTISVPPNRRGVKIRYHIKTISSHQKESSLLQV
ncbi:MAG: hypothetical protein ICV66_09385 [Chitinophagaceae bacterium]|nr:hypothetical protein [Chitinophagaceae bacterium]